MLKTKKYYILTPSTHNTTLHNTETRPTADEEKCYTFVDYWAINNNTSNT